MAEEQAEVTSADRWLDHRRPVSPAPSNVSMKSERSKGEPLSFSKEEPGWLDHRRPVSPAPSNVSMKSERSKGEPLSFSKEEPGWLDHRRPVSPAPSNVSMKSERSKGEPLSFSKEEPGWLDHRRPVSPAPSNVSMKSERSKGEPLSFSKEEPGWLDHRRPVSPAPSNVSMKSERSKGEPLSFSKEEPGWLDHRRPVSPAPSNVSMKSERSKGEPLSFSKEEPGWLDHRRPVSPAPSNVSMKSERSKGEPLSFSKEEPGWLDHRRPVSPAPSNVSMKSERSKGEPLSFSKEEPGWLDHRRSVSPAPSNVSMKSERSKGEPLSFSKEEPGWLDHRRPVSPAPSNVSMKSERSKGEPLSFSKEEPGWLEHRRPVSPAPSNVSIKTYQYKGETLDFPEPGSPQSQEPDLMAPSKDSEETDNEMDDSHNSKDLETLKRRQQLVSTLRKRFIRENTQDEDKDHPNQTDTEHIMREDRSSEVNDKAKNERTVAKSVTPVNSVSDIFKDTEGKPVKTVLTIGEAGIGKSFHVQKFIKEWAKSDKQSFLTWLTSWGTAKDDKEVIFPLNFSELNLMKEEKVSMVGLLNHFFKETEKLVISDYERFKVVFVLDGLDAYQPPLDFNNTNTLTDVREPASVDVLLTNLIRGNLLPSARLWITSRPSAAKQLPDACVDRTTEIRCKDVKPKLTAELKKKILSQHEDELRKDQNDTELYAIDKKSKDDEVKTYDALFQKSKKKEARTVLMTGVAGVGKTFQTRRFMVDRAKGKSNKNIDLIVSFKFSEMNSRGDEVQSMKDLLRHYHNDSKHSSDCDYNKCKVAFVLDGLEECELPLDFDNNKKLTDIEEPALMDVLLTNLIKGNLLPSALLWIISRPEGVEKIPSDHIQKVTECRETLKRQQQLVSSLRERFIKENTQDEDKDHPNQTDTEHILREDRSSEVNDEAKNERTVAKSVTPVNSVSDIFKDTEGKPIKTVLTIGEAGIGKSFHVQKFIKEWARSGKKSFLTLIADSAKALWGKAKDDGEVIFPLNFSELNLMKAEKVSMVGLLNRFFKETKEFVISDYEKFKVVFVLDGLDAYQPPLDFNNNNNNNNNNTLTDVREPASVDVLLTNLIRGNLLPSARLWITSRPSAAKPLPDACVDRTTEIRCKPDVVSQEKLKTQLQEQFTFVSEGIDKQRASALLNDIYTDLYIIEGERGEVNDQHETRQVQDAKFKPVTEETSIKYLDIFKPAPGENKPIRTVLTIGVAGIGKSFATMKYMLDWAEGAANGDIFYMFPLSFRELNLRNDKEHSLEELINSFFPGMETSEITDYDKYKILIVLDGFDECRLDLDFKESNSCKDVREPTSVNALLTNLIQGNLLSKAQIWITSRPAASNRIPPGDVDRVTEVRGFNDEQKEEYFRKRFSDKDLAEKILSHVKQSRSLYIMCHVPVFCWITSTVLEDFVSREDEMTMPKTLTDMYIYFLLLQCRQAKVKYGGDETGESSETDSDWNTQIQETVISLGKLAFEGLEEGNLLFTEENLTECGADITNTAVFSGLFTQIKREGRGMYQQKLFCFVHLSIQEFLAAFYVFQRFNDKGENLLTKPASTVADLPALDFYKTAVDKALKSQNGDWDMFLRFLLGLSLDTNQSLLRELQLLTKTENNEETYKATTEYIKEKIREKNSDADKNCNLFHCLNELNDHSLVDEVRKYLHSETVTFETFSASQWSALTFVLLTSDEKLDVFDLKKYRKSEEVLLGMLPVVKVSKTALLSWCELSEKSCQGLSSSVLSSASSNLTKLDLSHNDLLDSGVETLAEGLKSIHCKLEILKLSGCQVTEKGCSFLASAIRSKTNSSLKLLDLSYNHPGANGERMLSDIVNDTNMSLETLCLDHGGEHRLKPGLKKYGADLKFDENTASRRLVLSDGNRKVKTFKKVEEKIERPESEDRFKRSQVMCEEGQRGLCYWEVEWKGGVGIAVTYKRVSRKWDRTGGLGCNEMSWSLLCSKTGYTAIHGKTSKDIKMDPCQKIAVFLDWEGGTLTYYSVTSGNLSLIHTFHAEFTEPVFPGFWFKRGSATLCEID